MRILKKIKQRIASTPKLRRSSLSSGTQLGPLRFNTSIHGDNIRISSDGLLAKRSSSFCKSIVFSSRPLHINEEMSVRVTNVSYAWSGSLRFGFTRQNPVTMKHRIPKYMCPDLTNQFGNYAKALNDRESSLGTVVTFWLNHRGEVMYRINDEDRGLFLVIDNFQPSVPMWAMIDVYGVVTSIKMVYPRHNVAADCSQPQSPQHQQVMQRRYSVSDLTDIVPQLASMRLTTAAVSTPQPQVPLTTTRPLAAQNLPRSMNQTSHNYYNTLASMQPKPINTTTRNCSINSAHSYSNEQLNRPLKVVLPSTEAADVKPCNIKTSQERKEKDNHSMANECTVCFENPINCVLYMCGHMCMCYTCAVKQWHSVGGGQCPICRAYICDVIRTYWS